MLGMDPKFEGLNIHNFIKYLNAIFEFEYVCKMLGYMNLFNSQDLF